MPEVDLTNCDREPIHVIGHIQPHGALVVVDPQTLAAVQASASVSTHFGLPAEAMIGRSFLDFLPSRWAGIFEDAASDAGLIDNPTHLGVVAVNGLGPFHLVAHAHERWMIVEAEPAEANDAADYRALPQRLLRSLQSARDLETFYDAIVRETRRLTGFHRVMLYRFSEDGSGVVVAEDVEPHMDPFLGLNYPASDIPQQARRLFALNPVRLYPDIAYVPSPMEPAEAPAIDMTYCVLRGVSTMHTRYLENMGVRASMALAITQGERLWGLVAAHHEAPRTLPYPLRASCELLAGFASMQIVEKEALGNAGERERTRDVLDRLVSRLGRTPRLPSTIVEGEDTILDLVPAAGAAFVAGGEIRTLGVAPSGAAIREIVAWLDARQEEAVWAIDERATADPDAVGLLSAQVSRAAGAYVLWFRPETARTVRWAGNPDKPVETSEDGDRLSPRGSFAVWREEVAGRSRPWRTVEIEVAERLRLALVETLIHRTDEIVRLNVELERRNEDLDTFAQVAAHDLKEPLRGIRNYAQFLQEDYAKEIDEEGQAQLATIARLSGRLEGLLDSLLRFARVSREELGVRDCDIATAVSEAEALLASALKNASASVVVQGPLPIVRADLDLVVEIFVNLITNAIKYNDSGAPRIVIGAEGKIVTVRDNGIGIPEKHHEAVFTLFKRLHAREAFGGGTGMGLTIVKKAMERLGGRVALSSQIGAGTTFTLEFAG